MNRILDEQGEPHPVDGNDTIPMEYHTDPMLAQLLDCSISTVQIERTRAYVAIQNGMRERGHSVPDDLTEFAEWCCKLIREVETKK